jgi:ComF family protein
MNKGIKYLFKDLLQAVRLSIFLCRCPLCGIDLVLAGEEMICRECLDKISLLGVTATVVSPVCPVCSRPLGYESEHCGECLTAPPLFRKHISYGRYEEELRELILRYKYGGMEKLKHLLAGFYVETYHHMLAKNDPQGFDFIIPVPPDRGRKREFNPVLEIVKIFSQRVNIPLLTGYLVKDKKTLPQAGLTRHQRLNNLNGAFLLKGALPSLKGRRVLLADDVYTTGTTIRKCTELLVKEGADVVAMTLARSI